MSRYPDGLSGSQLTVFKIHKHGSDTAALAAVSKLYSSFSTIEKVNVDRYCDVGVPDEEKADDWMLLQDVASDLRAAGKLWEEALEHCREVQKLAPTDEVHLLDVDIATFEALIEKVGELVASLDRGRIPFPREVHAVTALVRDQLVIAERRAVAYQGLPGHLPKESV